MSAIDQLTRRKTARPGKTLLAAKAPRLSLLVASSCSVLLSGGLPSTAAHADEPTGASSDGTFEIVVTAQRRSESVQDVPISIAVFDAKQLSDLRIEQSGDLAAYTPGLTVSTSQFGDPVFALRGLGMNNGNANQNPAVTEYIGGVALPSIALFGQQIFDLERVEVLKGPQGDLYGRNSTGGAINFIPAPPTQDFTSSAEFTYGNYNLTELDGEVGGGVSDTLALRFAAHATSRDGWQDLVTSDNLGGYAQSTNGAIEREAMRASALWTPTDSFDLLVVGDANFDNSQVLAYKSLGYTNNNGSCAVSLSPGLNGQLGCPVYAISPATGKQVAIADTSNDPSVGFGHFAYGNRNDVHLYGANVTMNWTLPGVTLTSVSGARDLGRDTGSSSGSPYLDQDTDRLQHISSYSEELRASSENKDSPFQWVGGAYFSKDYVGDFSLYNFAQNVNINGLFNENIHQSTQTAAAFVHAEYAVSDTVKLIAGLRETRDNVSFTYSSGVNNPAGNPAPVPFFHDSLTSDGLSGKLGIDYTIDKNVMLYADASRGFKGAGYPGDIGFDNVADFAPYRSETLYAYEAGVKATVGTLQFDGAGYYYNWKNMQASTEVSYNVGGQSLEVITLGNAGNARIYGLDTDAVWHATKELSLRGGLNLTNATILTGVYKGESPVQSPKLSTNIVVTYKWLDPIHGFLPFVSADYNYRTSTFFTLPNVQTDSQSGYGLLGARAGLTTEDGGWEVSAWGRNLTNRWYLADAFGGGSTFLADRHLYADPRTFGVTIRRTF
jgi:iron complex outermembrane receptor protein